MVQVIVRRSAPAGLAEATSSEPEEDEVTAAQSPFARLLAEEPGVDGPFDREYRTPSLVGRVRLVGGMQEELDPFHVRYTAATSHAIRLGASAVGV